MGPHQNQHVMTPSFPIGLSCDWKARGLPPEFLRLGPIADDGDVRRARRFFRTQAAEQPPRQSRPLPWRSTQCLSHARKAEPPPPMGEPVEQPDAGDSWIVLRDVPSHVGCTADTADDKTPGTGLTLDRKSTRLNSSH